MTCLIKCFLGVIQAHVEGYHELSAKTKAFFSTAVAEWDAEFYIKVDDDVHVNLGRFSLFSLLEWIYFSVIVDVGKYYFSVFRFLLIGWRFITGTLAATLARHRSKPRVYIGCMKSGPVLYQK